MKKERNNTIITEYCYEKTNYNQYQSCSEEKHFLCGRIFVATDIEYGATIYSCPQPCKRCGGIRTLPVLHTIFISVYEKLWVHLKNVFPLNMIFAETGVITLVVYSQ